MSEELYRPDVVAGKYDAALFDTTGETLLVNEVFYSLQGEGLHSGLATVFVRLAKCNLACKFCDTEFETFTKLNAWKVIESVHNSIRVHSPGHSGSGDVYLTPWVDLTGGEPGLQNCDLLIERLHLSKFKVGIETSGSVWADWMTRLDHVTVSPKVPYSRIPDKLKACAGEFKWVVNAAFLAMYEKAPESVFHFGAPNFLQPESNHPKWIAAAVKLILRHPELYRMSLQMHKMMGLP